MSARPWKALGALFIIVSWTVFASAQDLGPKNWPWGEGDERGAANRMTSDTILSAIAKVKEGKIVELSHDVAEGAPMIPGFQTAYVLNMYRTAPRTIALVEQVMGATNKVGVNIERIEMTAHVSTHIDALGHFTIDQEMYNGVTVPNGITDMGLTHGGIEKAPPFIARATLIDVAGYKGVDHLEAGYAIQPADLEGALTKQGASIKEGTIALVYTGYSKRFMKDPEYAHRSPGLGLAAAKWLTSRGVIAIGADNHAVEVLPNEHEGVIFPVHQHTLVSQGVYLIENLKLDELAEMELYEATMILLPTKYRGATGSPARVIALY